MAELNNEERELAEKEKPPSRRPRQSKPWRVAVIANVKGETPLPENAPADAGAEFDKIETIQAIQAAIESDGHTTKFLSGDEDLFYRLKEYRPDICFNITEGVTGDGREAHVPALLEMLQIPYTCSRVVANAIGLDKTMTKRVWHEMGLPTATYQEFTSVDETINSGLIFPLFVKPAREGTGMGVDENAVVFNERQLRERVDWVIRSYQQPALVEDFLPGREFTIGVLGRADAALYSHMPSIYQEDGFHRFPVLEVDSTRSVTPSVYGHFAKTLHVGETGVPDFLCPADVDPQLAAEFSSLAIKAHQAIGALDVSRVDIRLDIYGKPRLLEINTLPGLTPDFSDLCVMANAENLSYQDLILEILYLGASRFNLMPARLMVKRSALASIG